VSVIVKDQGYDFTTPQGWNQSQSIGYMPALIAAAEKYRELDKALEEIPDEGITKYHNNVNVSGILLEIEGVPWGVVMMLDDALQFVPFNQTKSEETE
jgi:hypothetical protein